MEIPDRYDTKRKYTIPPGILREGKNVIAVRVVDNGGRRWDLRRYSSLKNFARRNNHLFSRNWKFQVDNQLKKTTTTKISLPSLCYNAMINPLIPYAFMGVLWYQGESNAGRSFQYRKAFPLLINYWRQKWNNPNMPFYFVQLATFNNPGNSNEGCGWVLTQGGSNTYLAIT